MRFAWALTPTCAPPNMRYHLALLDGEVVGMIGLHLQFHLHHVNWIGEIQGTGGDAAGARSERRQ